MKQLKVITSSYTSTNGIFTASFKDSFTIEPESRIMFDKIAFTINQGNTTAISIPNQTIILNPTANYPQGTPRTVIVPAGNYATLNDLYKAMNTAMNAVLDSDPLYPNAQNVPSDLGLAFYNVTSDTSPNCYEFVFDQVQNSLVTTTDINNMDPSVINGVNVYTPTLEQPFWMYDTNPLLAGALSASTSIFYFNSSNTALDTIDFNLGLFDESLETCKFGIGWIDGTMNLIVDGESIYEFPNPQLFNNTNNPNIRCHFFVRSGNLWFTLCDMSDADPTNWTYIIDPIAYTGYDVNQVYNFCVYGVVGSLSGSNLGFTQFLDTNDEVIVTNNIGYYYDTSKIKPLTYTTTPPLNLPIHYAWNPPTENVFERSIRLDFTNANALLNGLNIGTPIPQTLVSTQGFIIGILPAGFVANQELELDVFDLPLESYVANAGGNSGRVNCVTFFTPTLLNPISLGSAQFIFENKNMPFISIKNKFPQVIESLSFRLYNPVTPTNPIHFSSISFNMYIQSPKDGLPIAFA